MNTTGVESLVRMVVGGIFTLALVSFVAKDGKQMGDFISAVGGTFGTFAKAVQAT